VKRTEGYWSFRRGECEPTTEDRLEIEARTKEIREAKQSQGQIKQEYNAAETRHSTAVYRCQGNGSRHKANMIGRNY